MRFYRWRIGPDHGARGGYRPIHGSLTTICAAVLTWNLFVPAQVAEAATSGPVPAALSSGTAAQPSREQTPAPADPGAAPPGSTAPPQPGPQTFTLVRFRVASYTGQRLRGARVIVIDPDGDVITTGLTDASGEYIAPVPERVDGRFASVRRMGTVTAIVLADGYNEQVVFVIPVLANAVQPVLLNPVQSGARNEPHATLGNLHRQDIQILVNTYASKLGLKRQTPIAREHGYAPWGPTQEPRMTHTRGLGGLGRAPDQGDPGPAQGVPSQHAPIASGDGPS